MKIAILNITLFLVLCSMVSVAQLKSQQDSSKISIPTLEEMLEAAMTHSPYLQSKEIGKDIKASEIIIEKRKWMSNLFIEGTANYGVFDQVVIQDQTSDEIGRIGSLTQSEQTRYYAGVSVKIPISDLTTRSTLIKVKKMGEQQAQFELMEAQNQLRTVIIQAYYNLLYLKESMNTFFHIYQTLEIGQLQAEKDVLNGRTSFNEFALLSSTVGKAKDNYSKAKNLFYAQYFKLQELTGMIF